MRHNKGRGFNGMLENAENITYQLYFLLQFDLNTQLTPNMKAPFINNSILTLNSIDSMNLCSFAKLFSLFGLIYLTQSHCSSQPCFLQHYATVFTKKNCGQHCYKGTAYAEPLCQYQCVCLSAYFLDLLPPSGQKSINAALNVSLKFRCCADAVTLLVN